MAMPVVMDVTTVGGKNIRVKLPIEIWQRNKSWSFKVDTNEEIQTITLDPEHVFPDNNEENNTWTAAKGLVEKDVVLDSYLGTYSNQMIPIKITFTESYSQLMVEITNYPQIPVQNTGKDTFESKEAGLKFEFNEAKHN